ncbi:hypothetical protein Dimus_002458 [Dionaea muscipula]
MSAAALAVSASPTRLTSHTALSPPSSPSFPTSMNPVVIHGTSSLVVSSRPIKSRRRSELLVVSQLCAHETLIFHQSTFVFKEAVSDDELWAAACLRVRSFNNFRDSYGIEDHKRYLTEIEYEALKERIAGETKGFRRVSCINASVPLSELMSVADDLCSKCKYSDNGEERVVVGTLDLNQCVSLPNEITGMKPQGIGADFLRAYLSSVCVAKELQRNGVGYALISKSKAIAEEWGIIHLYVHVAADNEPAKRLYLKSGFIHESDEPVQEARFLGRPRRTLLWFGLPNPYNLPVTNIDKEDWETAEKKGGQRRAEKGRG